MKRILYALGVVILVSLGLFFVQPKAEPSFGAPVNTFIKYASTTATSANVFCLTADTCITTWGSASVPGLDTQVIFNDGSAFGADAGLTFNKVTANLAATYVSSTALTLSAYFQTGLTDCDLDTQGINYDLDTGTFTCGDDDTGGGSTFTGFLSSPYYTTDGSTTSTLRSNALYIATSTSNIEGLFAVNSSGNVSASGTLKIFGLSSLTGFISSASSSVNAGLQVSGNLSASSTLTVSGLSTFSSLATLSQGFISNASSSISAGLQVSGALNASSTLLVNSLSTLSGGFLATGSSTVTGAFYVSGVSKLMGLVFASSGLQLGGSVNSAVSSTFIDNGLLQIGQNTTTYRQGVFFVDASSGNNGNTFASGTLRIAGLSTFVSGFISNASSSFGGALTVSGLSKFIGAINTSSTLLIGGTANASVSSTLISNAGLQIGYSTGTLANGFNRGLFYVDTTPGGNGNTFTSGTLRTSGLSTFSSGFISNASSSIGAGLTVSGVSTLIGAINASSTLLIGGTSNATVSTSLFSNAGLYIGQNSTTFRSGFFSVDTTPGGNGNTFTSGTLRIQGLSTLVSGFISNASSSIGAGLQVAGALNASSSLFVSTSLFIGQIINFNNGKLFIDGLTGNVSASGTLSLGDQYKSRTVLKSFGTYIYGATTTNSNNDMINLDTTDPAAYLRTVKYCSTIVDCTNGCESQGANKVGYLMNVRHSNNRSASTTADAIFTASISPNTTTTQQTWCPAGGYRGGANCTNTAAFTSSTIGGNQTIWAQIQTASGTPMSVDIKCYYEET